ncbi:na(+)-translocating NADH-quinone reductase subunit B, partial [Vibrio parahaemolyticus V-223/04]
STTSLALLSLGWMLSSAISLVQLVKYRLLL